MLNQVQHDKPIELQVAKRLTMDTIRSLQDDKASRWALAERFTAPPIRFLPSVEMTSKRGRQVAGRLMGKGSGLGGRWIGRQGIAVIVPSDLLIQ
jgi:hypothetical protein